MDQHQHGYQRQGSVVYDTCTVRRYNEDGWLACPRMPLGPRCGHGFATLFNDASVVVGGYAGAFDYLSSAELLDETLSRWRPLSPMCEARTGPACVVGPCGAVYVAGRVFDLKVLSYCAVYN
jgi:hypothetical protein